MKIAILGAGAIGTLFAATLASECEIYLLVREARTARAIANEGGVALEGGTRQRVRVAHTSHESDRFLNEIALVLVAVKTYATIEALTPLRDRLPREAPIVSLQNGIDAPTQIVAALGERARVALAPTTEAATWLAPGLVRRTAIGATKLGWATVHPNRSDNATEMRELTQIAELFTRCDIKTEIAMPIEPHAWAKLIANAAINPITALTGLRNGEILTNAHARTRAAALATEAYAIARAEQIALPFTDPIAEAERIMSLTAPNRSSMLQDLDHRRPTELEAISGTLLRLAAKHKMKAPETQRVYDELNKT